MRTYNDACSVTVNVDLDSESMFGSQCRSYDGETSVTFRSNITYAILLTSSANSALFERSITFKLLIGIIVRLENNFACSSRLN